jgi:predicted nucleic acid-binding protein
VILADTSVWVAHLRQREGHTELIRALEDDAVTTHPFVEGELLLAGADTALLLGGVPTLPLSDHNEVKAMLRDLPVPVRGVGWVDVHLLHAALVAGQRLLTRDRALGALFAAITSGRRPDGS